MNESDSDGGQSENEGEIRSGARRRLNRKSKKQALGDDLGSENYLLASTRLEFLSIPYLMDLNLRTFTYAELAFYPSLRVKGLLSGKSMRENTRLSAGFGMCLPVNQMITIILYYNALNFNSLKGDHERRGYINFNIGFF